MEITAHHGNTFTLNGTQCDLMKLMKLLSATMTMERDGHTGPLRGCCSVLNPMEAAGRGLRLQKRQCQGL